MGQEIDSPDISENHQSSEAALEKEDQCKMQELLLPVHGYVKLYPEEIAIIDHPSFQRLRRMRQLGFAHMVFPGGTHTRFEHAVGATHVAQSIISSVNENYEHGKAESGIAGWTISNINYPTTRFIRLGALLHDIGHVPFGHTLEDELNHLPSHDYTERLSKISQIKFPDHELDRSIFPSHSKPVQGWSLEDMVNVLYQPFARLLRISETPFNLLTLIICKEPKKESDLGAWKDLMDRVGSSLKVSVCRDIVGNTICADFLDYLFRDWHHLGKPFIEDKRLYQYMEVRTRKEEGQNETARFAINVRESAKIRHDALTDILDLLGSRYKLAETVLFHRTKLAIIGLLDRCLLETREVYRLAGIDETEFRQAAEDLLIDGSDDALPAILKELAAGGTENGKKLITSLVKQQADAIEAALRSPLSNQDELPGLLRSTGGAKSGDRPDSKGEIALQLDLVHRLVERLKNRCVYTLAYKVGINDLPGVHAPGNRTLAKLIDMYHDPKNRLIYLQGVEALCGLPQGSLALYCPPDGRMNAKVAKVNLFIQGDITPFDQYEESQGEASLTHDALKAQVKRFYELWCAQVFIDRTCWDRLDQFEKNNLQSVLKEFFFQINPENSKVARGNIQRSVEIIKRKLSPAARLETRDLRSERFKGKIFPSGLGFEA